MKTIYCALRELRTNLFRLNLQARLALRLSVLGTAAVALVTTGATACVTRLETVGDWSRPSELHLAENYLKGLKVQVQCGMVDKRDRILARRYPLCRDLQDLINDSGAQVVGSTDPTISDREADLHFYYLDTGKTESSQSGFALAGFLVTGGLIPLVFTGTSEAEFRIIDKRGLTIDRAPMKIAQIRAFGWGAALGLFGPSLKAQKIEVSYLVFHYAKNRLASQALRLRRADLP